jgi:hypothetical protein
MEIAGIKFAKGNWLLDLSKRVEVFNHIRNSVLCSPLPFFETPFPITQYKLRCTNKTKCWVAEHGRN